MSSYAARTREMFRKYGKVAVGVHFAVYFTGLGACYVAVERGVKVDKFLRGWGLMGEKKEKVAREAAELPQGAAAGAGAGATASTSGQQLSHDHDDDDEDDGRNWFARALSGRGSSLALAFVANKALFPVRAPITLGLTPAVARALRVNAARSAAASASSSSSTTNGGAKSGNGGGGGGSGGSGSSNGGRGGGASPQ